MSTDEERETLTRWARRRSSAQCLIAFDAHYMAVVDVPSTAAARAN
ncbi:MAG: hypothetical protein WAW17_02630 [Rhodococcus sp. (in: high G+C Gram-positive bacteria)]